MFPLSQGSFQRVEREVRSTKATLYRPDGPPQRKHWVLGHPRTSRSVRNSASYIQGHPIFRACWADHVPLAPNFTYRWAMKARSRRSRLHGDALVVWLFPNSRGYQSYTVRKQHPRPHRKGAAVAQIQPAVRITLRRTNARTVGSRFAHGI